MENAPLDFDRLGSLLEYPSPSLPQEVEKCITFTPSGGPAELLQDFRSFLATSSLSRMEEVYTRTFDLQAVCIPYVGYHLFGEDYRRSLFLAGLKKIYRENNFSTGRELPDHLAVMLRFLAQRKDGEESRELIRDGLIPSLEKMISCFPAGENPYKGLLQALLLILKGMCQPQSTERAEENSCPSPFPHAPEEREGAGFSPEETI